MLVQGFPGPSSLFNPIAELSCMSVFHKLNHFYNFSFSLSNQGWQIFGIPEVLDYSSHNTLSLAVRLLEVEIQDIWMGRII